MKTYQKVDAATLVEVPTETLQHLATEYISFKTGSRVFGGESGTSDWDVCVLNSEGIYEKLVSEGFREPINTGSNEHTDGGCANLIKGNVNVILLTPTFFNAWRVATEAMKHVGGDMRDKNIRVRKFRYIRDGYINAANISEGESL